MKQVDDFLVECQVLAELVEGFDEKAFDTPSLFKSWSANDVLVHLYFWNRAADLSLFKPEEFSSFYDDLRGAMKAGTLRAYENANVRERSQDLVSLWSDQYQDMVSRWRDVDPKTRVKWAGPDMSVRSSISARQMETWAHGQALFDQAGKIRPESDRISNIVYLGVNAFGWSHIVHGMDVPAEMPRLALVSPSGENWSFGEGEDLISGSAVEFCQVVTQTRNVADTDLEISGETARIWMENAQCFAGPPENPPAPGVRVNP